ncbi:Thiol-disulfide oxidoreductase ResA [termite gut metagenome]|uniref:Thiol-disulfide oxidoreductase ResA n=1 Tax=termite gut metagenome TaxID=433724 RepID=A0A5J4QZP7_9ZZZZ
MKYSALSLLFLLFASVLSAKDVVIVNPVYEVKTTGITNISKIELKANETQVHLHTVFLPHWWVKFSTANYIEDCATGKKLYPTGMENGEFEKKIYMPDSGDSTFVLLFPALDKSVKKINYINADTEDPSGIYGILLNPKTKAKAKAKQDTPPAVLKWIENEIAKAKRKTLMNEDEFFLNDTVHIVGYIKGYSPLIGFSTGMVYVSNSIAGEDYPIVIQIYKDGRFEGKLPVNHPQYFGLLFGTKYIHFYIEPGQTLGMVLDWEEFLLADRLRDRQYTFKDIRFFGPTALINQELTTFYSQEKELPYRMLYSEESTRKTPDEYKALLNSTTKEYKENLQWALNEKNWDERTKTFFRNNYAITYATFLLRYQMSYVYGRKGDKLPLDFYDFLQDIAMNDRKLLSTSEFDTFINLFGFSNPFRVSHNAFNLRTPKKSYTAYLFEELGFQKTPEDIAYLEKVDSANIYLYGNKQEELSDQEKKDFQAKLNEMSSAFGERYEKQMKDYQKKYLDPLSSVTYADIYEEMWRINDSICYNVLKLKPNLLYDITKVRSLDFTFSEMIKDKKQARTFLAKLESGIAEPFLIAEAERLFSKNYPEDGNTAYELEVGKASEIFKKIIDPFKGKVVFVDFWGIFCGPCIANIQHNKALRSKYKDHEEVAFIFVTSDVESPLDRYDKFVEEQELVNTYRLLSDEYNYLRQLFKFNGIPHYVMVDKEGQIVDDNYHMENVGRELEKITGKTE